MIFLRPFISQITSYLEEPDRQEALQSLEQVRQVEDDTVAAVWNSSEQSVDSYMEKLNTLLEQQGMSFDSLHAMSEQLKVSQTANFKLTGETSLMLTYEPETRKVLTVTLLDSDFSTFDARWKEAKGVFFAAAYSSGVSVDDVNVQLDYLTQMLTALKEYSYSFEGALLSAKYGNKKSDITISLTLH